jgi:hypothetical protein
MAFLLAAGGRTDPPGLILKRSEARRQRERLAAQRLSAGIALADLLRAGKPRPQ